MPQNGKRKLIVSEWMSLDGVFDASTFDLWYNPFESPERQNLIRETTLAADTFLFGRTTYEMLAGYWGPMKNNEMGIADKMNSTPKYVVSTTLKKADWNNSTIIKKNVAEKVAELKQQGGRYILLFGSATLVQSLMGSNLIDEYRFLLHPAIAGNGARFFKDGMPTTKLKVAETKPVALGVTLLRATPTSS